MPTLELPSARIAYSDDDQGGESVLLVHGSLSADWFVLVARDLSRLGCQRMRRYEAHIIGHSSGADIALQLAFGHPDLVSSLILLEPAFPFAPDEPQNTSAREAWQAARNGDFDRAFDLFLGGACGPTFREVFLRQTGEEGLSNAIASANYFFTTEASAFRTWTCTPADLASVHSPALMVVGGEGQRLGTPI